VSNGGTEEQPDSFHFAYDPEAEDVTQAIVEAVGLIHDTSHEHLTPLETVVNTDALAAVLRSESGSVTVTFHYEELVVTANDSGDIWLQWA